MCWGGCQYYLAVYLDFDYGFLPCKSFKNFYVFFFAYRYGVIVFSFRVEFTLFFFFCSVYFQIFILVL